MHSAVEVHSDTSFADAQRRVGLYLRALWGRSFELAAGEDEPYVRDEVIHLPASADADLYRAAATHAAAHLVYAGPRIASENLRPRQLALIGLIEDARVEHLAMRVFPGLARLWRRLHPPSPGTEDFEALLARLARALFERGADPHAWVSKGVALFHDGRPHWEDPGFSYELGMRLANDIGQLRIPMNTHASPRPAPYRDDNRHLFVAEQPLDAEAQAIPNAAVGSPDGARFVEREGGADLIEGSAAATGPEAFRIRHVERDAALSLAPESIPESEACLYPEWNYRLDLYRHDWCRLVEYRARSGSAADAERVYERHAATLRALRRQLGAWQVSARRRVRRQQDGEELDVDAVHHAMVQLRAGQEPDPRVYWRTRSLRGDAPAVLVVLDLSASLRRRIGKAGCELLELARDAALLLAETLQSTGHRFAVHGFRSDGRGHVGYHIFKDFEEPYGETVRGRLAGMDAEQSTRLGTALRHGGRRLAREQSRHRLLLLISDGEPSDIDVYHEGYLRHDARAAVAELKASGSAVHCINLDPAAHSEVSWIFGVRGSTTVPGLEELPHRLPRLYMTLAGLI